MRTLLAVSLLVSFGFSPIGSAVAESAEAQGVVVISADPSVQGPEIRLAEIARFDALAPERVARLAELSLGRSAAPSRARPFSGAALRLRVLEVDPDVRVEVPDEVRVHTAYREIAPEFVRSHVERAIRHRLPWPSDTVHLSGWRLPESFAVPVSAERTLVHFRTDESFLRRVHVEIELVAAEETQPPIRRSASVNLRVELPVLITARELRRGAVLGPDDMVREERELGSLPMNVLRDPERAVGLRLARRLAAGTPLVPGYLVSAPLVKRGDPVRIHAERSGLSVVLEARALDAGTLGETIRVENPKTRYRFQVQVSGPGAARMIEPGVGSGR